MPSLSIISATPPSINPGMVLSDAAAKAFVELNQLGDIARFFRVVPDSERLAHVGDLQLRQEILAGMDSGVQYATLSSPEQLSGTIPLFWGDFLHEKMYIDVLCSLYQHRSEQIYGSLLLSNEYEPLRSSAITFGTTLVHNRTLDYLDRRYAADLTAFLRQAAYVSFRDAYSAAMAQQIRLSEISCLGTDAVQLLHIPAYREKIIGADNMPATPQGVGVYFARYQHDIANLTRFVIRLSTLTGGDPSWIDWGDSISFPYISAVRSAFTAHVCETLHPIELARRLARYRLVVTDTYHCAVTAWCMGVPAILVTGRPHDQEVRVNPLHFLTRIDKRSTLYYQHGLNDFIVPNAMLESADYAEIFMRKIADGWLAPAGEALLPLLKNLEAFARHVEARLAGAVRQGIEPATDVP